jgi:hypothetical protein
MSKGFPKNLAGGFIYHDFIVPNSLQNYQDVASYTIAFRIKRVLPIQ